MVDSDVPAQAAPPRESESDAELTMRFEREALPLLDALYRGALTLTGDRRVAEHLLEETMMNAYRQFGSLSQSTNLRASLYRLLSNANWRLQMARECPSTRLSLAEVEALDALPAAAITKALQTLRQDDRMVVYYADVEGLSYAEIADITNRSVSAVISLLHRGRHQLRQVLLACREHAACQFPGDASNNTTRERRPTPKYPPRQQLSEGNTSADQLDQFDRDIVRYVLLWAPHGAGWEEFVYPTFGMTVEQLVDRFRQIIDTFAPRFGCLATSDRELLDEARRLPRSFGQAR
jgi:RNA polymerase sigma-70 factor, ECF subfamily